MDLVLTKFVAYFHEICGDKNDDFLLILLKRMDANFSYCT